MCIMINTIVNTKSTTGLALTLNEDAVESLGEVYVVRGPYSLSAELLESEASDFTSSTLSLPGVTTVATMALGFLFFATRGGVVQVRNAHLDNASGVLVHSCVRCNFNVSYLLNYPITQILSWVM